MARERIAVIGLGKLGLPFAAWWAARGYDVKGVDINPDRVQQINSHTVADHEPSLSDLLTRARGKLHATTDLSAAVAASDVTFIMVNTPGEKSGKFTTGFVLPVCEQVGAALRDRAEPHMVVLASSVTAGSCDDEIIPALEQAAGTVLGDRLSFCYSPVFIALGNMVEDYVRPDLALIGESSSRAGDQLENMLNTLYEQSDVPVVRTSFMNAELIKLVLSTFITTKITYANMLASLCDALPGADVDVVAEALGLDKRISPKVLKGGMPYGGPCFPRDNRALLYLAEQVGVDGSLVQATDHYNQAMIKHLADRVSERVDAKQIVGILGLSFKPQTDVVEESASVDLANTLAERGVRVVAYDPQAMEAARSHVAPGVQLAASLDACLAQAQTLVVTTPWEEFRAVPELLSSHGVVTRVIDPWRLFSPDEFSGSIVYEAIGRGAVADHLERTSA